MRTYFIDLETTVNGGPTRDSPEAHWKNNKVLLAGYWRYGDTQVCTTKSFVALSQCMCDDIHDLGEILIVAHNAKFDLKYLMREMPEVPWEYVKVWDTMTWEYLASGHTKSFISLEDALDQYKISYKKSLDLGALLKQGVKMEDIPIEQLTSYLKDDVSYLQELYECQEKQGYAPCMDYILPLADMELNGMHVHKGRTEALGVKLAKEVSALHDYFTSILTRWCEWQDGSPIRPEDFTEMVTPKSKCIKPVANRTISFLLFGQPDELKITQKWRVRWRYGCTPMYSSSDARAVYGTDRTNKPSGFPMSEDDIHRIEDTVGSKPILDEVIRYRTKNKLLGTYVSPFLHTSSVQGTIHPKLNTAITATGRLSSSNPNGQNQPPESRELICAGDAANWDITEIDFKQLEMVGAASLSGCPSMQKAINNGEDLHYNSGRSVMGWKSPSDMVEKDRKLVKNVNFGVLYGGKAKGLSKQTGVSATIIQRLIDSFYKAYPGVRTWQKSLFKRVVDNMHPYDVHKGEQRYASTYTLPISNRRFTFVENEAPDWVRRTTGRGFSFSPNHTANYPIQGFAGGDLVMWALTWLWRAVRVGGYSDRVKFIMTVHDSIVLEVQHGTKVDVIAKAMCAETVKHFNLPVPLECDVESGQFWK